MAKPVEQALAVAVAEVRSLWRLPRTWILSAFAIAAGLTAYAVLAHLHATYSYLSSTAGSASPRFLVHFFGIAPLWVILFGVVFLAFDGKHRMVRSRIADVIDSRPLSNLALLSGRLAALLAVAGLVLLLTMTTVQGLGAAGPALGWRIGEPIQPMSLFTFVVIDGLPALAFWCTLVLLLSAAFRSRVLVLLIASALLMAQHWVLLNTPIRLLQVVPFLSGFGNFASDILPEYPDVRVLAQRGLSIVLAGGFLLAAALLGRPDNGPSVRRSCLVGTLVLTVIAVLGMAWLVMGSSEDTKQRALWRLAHQEAAAVERADLKHVGGRLRIDPGSGLELNVELRLAAPATISPQEFVFSFNPGMEVHELRVDGQPAEYWHDSGLLGVRPQPLLAPGTGFALAIRASGVPDPRFAYLDSAVDPLAESWADSLLPFLGTRASVFDKRYVALMPGTRWLPMPGVNLAADPILRPRDFFTIDLEVDTPPGWHVAAPGRGTQTKSPNSLRFNPNAPLSEVTVVAAPFERYAAFVHGVELELLFHPAHLRNVEAFAYLKDALLQSWQEFLKEADRFGIPYPYDGLSIVEVPAQLRVYGGGPRMDSIQNGPGVLLLREHGFPTANFHMFPLPEVLPVYMQRQVAINYFLRDRTGANLLVGATDNLLPLLTGGRGDNAEAAELLVTRLTTGLFGFRQSPFTAHTFTEPALSDASAPSAETHFSRPWVALLAGIPARIAKAGEWDSDHPSVWERATGSAWADFAGEDQAHRALATRALRSNAVARVLEDSLGHADIGKMLATLRNRHSGDTLTMEDVEAVVSQVSPRLAPTVTGWLHSRSAPGFVTSPARIRILPNDRYHVDVRVWNGESAAGVVRLELSSDAGDGREGLRSEVSATAVVPGNSSVQIGMLSAGPPLAVWLWSYLSLNRTDMRLQSVTETRASETEPPFVGVRPSRWRPSPRVGIIVDDLDAGFVVEPDRAQYPVQWLATAFSRPGAPANFLDQGIPPFRTAARAFESEAPKSRWLRQELGTAWGTYRRTVTRVASGGYVRRATFTARMPVAGTWRLEYHLPNLGYRSRMKSLTQSPEVTGVWQGGSLGTYHLALEAHGEELAIRFEAEKAVSGWNRVGTFELEAGDVRLHVSNSSSGETVIADAIRWRRAEPPPLPPIGQRISSMGGNPERKDRGRTEQ